MESKMNNVVTVQAGTRKALIQTTTGMTHSDLMTDETFIGLELGDNVEFRVNGILKENDSPVEDGSTISVAQGKSGKGSK
tara:strand:+ start:602 stop:841 length:240 start_codon:yes stop_codon:yes gene_type:complete